MSGGWAARLWECSSMAASSSAGSFPVARSISAIDIPPEVAGAEAASSLPALDPSVLGAPAERLIPRPPIRLCHLSLPQGCYQLSINTLISSPKILFRSFKLGSLRVQANGGSYVVSGDTYRYSMFDLLRGGIPSFAPTDIPVYPRSRYGSYLQATSITIPRISLGTCMITLVLDEFDYTQPPAGSFDGSFPTTPSRTLTVQLTPATPPSGYPGPYFSGQVYIGGALQTGVSLT